jgi:hypothetical protein
MHAHVVAERASQIVRQRSFLSDLLNLTMEGAGGLRGFTDDLNQLVPLGRARVLRFDPALPD